MFIFVCTSSRKLALFLDPQSIDVELETMPEERWPCLFFSPLINMPLPYTVLREKEAEAKVNHTKVFKNSVLLRK